MGASLGCRETTISSVSSDRVCAAIGSILSVSASSRGGEEAETRRSGDDDEAKTSDKPIEERRGLTIVPLACASSSLVIDSSMTVGAVRGKTGVVLLRIISRLINPFGSFSAATSVDADEASTSGPDVPFPTLLLILVRTLVSLLDKLDIEAVLDNENFEARLADELDRGRFLSHWGRSFLDELGPLGAAVARGRKEAGVGVVVRLGRSGVVHPRKVGPRMTGAVVGRIRNPAIVTLSSSSMKGISSCHPDDVPSSFIRTTCGSSALPFPFELPSTATVTAPHPDPRSSSHPGVPGVPSMESTLQPLSLTDPVRPCRRRSSSGDPTREGTSHSALDDSEPAIMSAVVGIEPAEPEPDG